MTKRRYLVTFKLFDCEKCSHVWAYSPEHAEARLIIAYSNVVHTLDIISTRFDPLLSNYGMVA